MAKKIRRRARKPFKPFLSDKGYWEAFSLKDVPPQEMLAGAYVKVDGVFYVNRAFTGWEPIKSIPDRWL